MVEEKEKPMMQQLVSTCARVFKEMREYSEEEIHDVKAMLDGMGAADVGLGDRGEQQPQIEFVDVLDSPTFTIGIFLLPKGTALPMHDHPGMTVIYSPPPTSKNHCPPALLDLETTGVGRREIPSSGPHICAR